MILWNWENHIVLRSNLKYPKPTVCNIPYVVHIIWTILYDSHDMVNIIWSVSVLYRPYNTIRSISYGSNRLRNPWAYRTQFSILNFTPKTIFDYTHSRLVESLEIFLTRLNIKQRVPREITFYCSTLNFRINSVRNGTKCWNRIWSRESCHDERSVSLSKYDKSNSKDINQ